MWIRDAIRAGAAVAVATGTALALATSVGAIVHSTGDGTSNTTPPPDDPGFANVGPTLGLTGVYLRGGFVLSAQHAGVLPITLGGVTYPVVPDSQILIKHLPSAFFADVAVYRIQGGPQLPVPRIASTPPQLGESVIVIGNGWNREATVTEWDASWNEVTPPGTYQGYKRAGGRAVRWGRNVIEFEGIDLDVAGRRTHTFGFYFNDPGEVDEAQAINGDSGGAVFVKRSGQWELAGILYASFLADANQPADTAAFGMATGAADLSYYRDQIMAAIVPPIPLLPGPWGVVLAGALAASARPVLSRRRKPAG